MALPFILIRIGYFFAGNALRSSLTLEDTGAIPAESLTNESTRKRFFSTRAVKEKPPWQHLPN